MPLNIKSELEAITAHIIYILSGTITSLDKAVLLNITARRAKLKARYV